MEKNLTLNDLIKIFKERILLIVFIMCSAILFAVIITYYMLTPVYETSTQILVNQERSEANILDDLAIETDLQLINTYSVIIKSPVILDKVIEGLDLDMTAKQLNKKLAVDSSEESQVINVTVKYEDPNLAVKIANMTAQVFQADIKTLMDVNNVSILTPAVPEDENKPVFPNPIANILAAAAVGLVLGSGIALTLSYLDNTLKNDEDVEKFLDIPVVGVISPIDDKEKPFSFAPAVLKREEV